MRRDSSYRPEVEILSTGEKRIKQVDSSEVLYDGRKQPEGTRTFRKMQESQQSSEGLAGSAAQLSSRAATRAAAAAGLQPDSSGGCASGALKFLPSFRGKPNTPKPSASSKAAEPDDTKANEAKSLRLAREASELRSLRAEVEENEKKLGEAWGAVERARERTRAAEKRLQDREAELQQRETAVAERESFLGADSKCLGVVLSLMPASDTLRAWIRLIEAAIKRIFLIFYTFDLDILCTALEAARKRGVTVRVIGDKQRVKSTKGTQQLLQRLRTHKVEIRLRDGTPLADHYTAGASASSGIVRDKSGIVHSKLLLADSNLILGSTNFTTSSQCNVESSSQIRLNETGVREVERYFSAAFEDGEEY